MFGEGRLIEPGAICLEIEVSGIAESQELTPMAGGVENTVAFLSQKIVDFGIRKQGPILFHVLEFEPDPIPVTGATLCVCKSHCALQPLVLDPKRSYHAVGESVGLGDVDLDVAPVDNRVGVGSCHRGGAGVVVLGLRVVVAVRGVVGDG